MDPAHGSEVVLYARFSPRPNAEECDSVRAQLATLRDICARRGWNIAGEYHDDAQSGDDFDRTGLWDAIAALKRGQTLIATRGNRLARHGTLLELIFAKVKKKRAAVWVSEGMPGDDTPEAEMLRAILSAVWRFEKRLTAAQTRAAKLRAMTAGRVISDDLPFGYRLAPSVETFTRRGVVVTRRMMEPCPVEHPILLRIVELHAGGTGFAAIAKALTAAGQQPRAGKWTRQKVFGIVKRAKVTGLGIATRQP